MQWGSMARFATILIDLDGTLVDAFTTIHRAYVHTLPQFGRPAPTMEQVRRAVGGGLENAMGHFLPPDLIAEAMKVHVAYTQQILLEDVTLMPGGMELLRSLHARGVKLGVLTNKQAEASRRICARSMMWPRVSVRAPSTARLTSMKVRWPPSPGALAKRRRSRAICSQRAR